MTTGSRYRITVAELLVAVLIIAVLALMLVPVLEARSEEARTATCQGNMQKIVGALLMYMADNDNTLPPGEHRPEVIAYFDARRGRECPRGRIDLANPYLRWPVILEGGGYLPERAVWQCPSAAIVNGAKWIVPGPDWFQHVVTYEDLWVSSGGGPCYGAWPSGWGGPVTDSILQQQMGLPAPSYRYVKPDSDVFIQSIGTLGRTELKLDEVPDPSTFVIAGDGGVQIMALGLGVAAYPELCRIECGNPCCGADWENCPSTKQCGAPKDGSLLANVSLRMPYSRHRARFMSGVPVKLRSGVNIGFLDGHIRWIASEGLIAKVRDDEYDGLEAWGPTSDDDWSGGYLTENGFVIY